MLNELGDFVFQSHYAQCDNKTGKTESWTTACQRVMNMHRTFYNKVEALIREELKFVEEMMIDKRVLGSQRALQFGGTSILKNHARIYNCAARYIDHPEAFHHVFFLLLCGVGCGFSVQTHHINKLPKIREYKSNDPSKIFIIQDSIESWADAVGILMSSFFEGDTQPFPDFQGHHVIFDFSLIRPKGASISNISGRAPGHEPLQKALLKIQKLLRVVGNRQLKPIEAYDVLMILADAVLAGGVRRSACLTIFSPDDEMMLTSKSGNWFLDHPERARSNNSMLLIRDELKKETLLDATKTMREFGEPGIILSDNKETLYNPCVSADTWIRTSEGGSQVKDLINTPFLAMVDGFVYQSSGFIKTGELPVCTVNTIEGYQLRVTGNHKVLLITGEWAKVKDLTEVSKIKLHKHDTIEFDHKHKEFLRAQKIASLTAYGWETCESHCLEYQMGFIAGVWKSRGEINDGFKISVFHEKQGQMFQRILHRVGIFSRLSYETLTIPAQNSFFELMEMNLQSHDLLEFSAQVSSITEGKIEKVYDCSVPDVKAFCANGFYVHNCVEVSLYGHLNKDSEKTGFQLCNLSEINMSKVKTEEDFYAACRAGSIIGTLQAGYTDFPYLGSITEMIVKREALIGVSTTGMCDNPKIAFDAEIQRKGAKIVKETNMAMAKKLGINPAARTTCIKPAGSTSCILGTASGIHPHHSNKYFRRVQCNKDDEALKFFQNLNPKNVRPSVWSTGETDDVITFCCEAPESALVKQDLPDLKLLANVRLTQENWVKYGTNSDFCVEPFLCHNVSNTVNVRPDEWENVVDYIMKNKHDFAGLTFLPCAGDKIYQQAPFQQVLSANEIVQEYGFGALLASGLIVQARPNFSTLFSACDHLFRPAVLPKNASIKKQEEMAQKDRWCQRATKFAHLYFDSNFERMTMCLKDVDALKEWTDICRDFTPVDWNKFAHEKSHERKKNQQAPPACTGALGCEIVRI